MTPGVIAAKIAFPGSDGGTSGMDTYSTKETEFGVSSGEGIFPVIRAAVSCSSRHRKGTSGPKRRDRIARGADEIVSDATNAIRLFVKTIKGKTRKFNIRRC